MPDETDSKISIGDKWKLARFWFFFFLHETKQLDGDLKDWKKWFDFAFLALLPKFLKLWQLTFANVQVVLISRNDSYEGLLLKYLEVNGWASEDSIWLRFLMIQCQDQFYPFEELFELSPVACKLFNPSKTGVHSWVFDENALCDWLTLKLISDRWVALSRSYFEGFSWNICQHIEIELVEISCYETNKRRE